ncbi:uncharacterized protein PV09_06415 [Verruconis gallopava]|uniref:Zn(2)-C6 fungal-type domain-containing protein n=1 Tax=Verruconis gallopava TaxID=253628 RepID=A0A0D2A6Q8_9PEZI|nr:uncharacterized protein PV09_06415 [Verruconis gallopava]KIW02265.1 hypothetical protein PV09_06415 [Verruconis gallopava]
MPGVSPPADKMTNKKRTSTQAAGEDGQEKPIKRRASTACQACRARKVRCNVLENGPPCTNCRLDDVQCTISIGKRRLGVSRGNAEAILLFSDHGPSDGVEGTYFSGFHSNHNHGHTHNHGHNLGQMQKRNLNGSPQHVPPMMHRAAFPAYNRTSNVSIESFPEQQYQFMETAFGRAAHTASPPISHGSADAQMSLAAGLPELRSSPANLLPPVLPQWVKPLPERINPDDAEFLARKGALSVHDSAFRNELLKCFIRWVYPWSPVISLDNVVRTMSGGNGATDKISLLLFQAMMFAGAGFADLAILRSAGFNSRKDARKHFFNRCKLLYDFEYEDDRLVLIQALVLMTYWHDSADDQKDIWHWITVAVALAQTIGLNQDPDTLEMSTSEKHLRKRVWWSLFMRDRLVALAMRRAAKIQLNESHVPPLSIADFDVYEGSASANTDFLKMDVAQRERIAMVSVECCKLCTIIGRILETQYSTTCIRRRRSGSQERPNTTTTMVLVPRKAQDDKIQVLALDAMLSGWAEDLPPEISYENIKRQGNQTDNFDMKLHCAQLSMLYHTAIIMLFRPAHLSHSANGTRLETTQESKSALDKTRDSGVQITRISTELESMNSVRYLLTVGVTIVVHAAMVQLIEAGSPNPTHRQQSIENLAKSMRVLEQLCDVYIAADLAVQLLHAGIAKAGIRLTTSGQQQRTSISPLSVIDEEPSRERFMSQAILQDKPASDMSLSEDPPMVSATDEFAPNLWPGLTPSGQTPGVDNLFGFHDTTFSLDENMGEFGNFGYGTVSGGKDGFFSESDAALLEPHLQWITT